MKYDFEYTEKYFRKIFMNSEKIVIEESDRWSNDSWFKDQGKIIGGNLCTLNLLQGTEYMPNLENSILFIEDDGLVEKNFNKEFDRNLQSLLHCAKNKNIKGIVVGRAENNYNIGRINIRWD